ncbi:MAG: 50S ribosomal protein L3 [Alphaproteobacteria bacterium]
MRRSGLIARKLGMTSLFQEDGSRVAATVLHVPECRVVSVRTKERDGYLAVQLGAGRKRHPNKPEVGHYAKAGVVAAARLAEFRVDSEDALLSVGRELSAGHFVSGQHVDIRGTTIGKGFAGSMKRHGFSGGRATHGNSVSHRAHGSTGQHQDPGKVFKNKKMAGHMGDRQRTAMNLRVLQTDIGEGLIFVEGSVPGSQDGWVLVCDAVKRSLPEGVPFPTFEAEVETKVEAEVETVVGSEIEAEAGALPTDSAEATEATEVTDSGEGAKESGGVSS